MKSTLSFPLISNMMNKCFSNVFSHAISFLSWFRLVRVYVSAPNCTSDTLIACIYNSDVIIFYACECAVCMWVCVGSFGFDHEGLARLRRQHFKYYLFILLQQRFFFLFSKATESCVRLYVKTVACFNSFVAAAMYIRRNINNYDISNKCWRRKEKNGIPTQRNSRTNLNNLWLRGHVLCSHTLHSLPCRASKNTKFLMSDSLSRSQFVSKHTCYVNNIKYLSFWFSTFANYFSFFFFCFCCCIPDDASPTTLQKFYQNKSVFLTGGTGFLGKIIIEKLLRSCEIDTIYVLVRSKKGKDIATRLEDIVNDVVFEKLKKQDKEEKFRHKIVPIEGDCSLPGLGMSEFDRQKLIENCNIVFHAAATVRFDEKLKLALAINVNGTREIMTLAKQLQSLVVSVVDINC